MKKKTSYEELEKKVQQLGKELLETKELLGKYEVNQAFLKIILDSIPAPVFYKDASGIYRDCNDTFSKTILGVPKEKIIGRSLYDLSEVIPRQLADIYQKQDQALLQRPGIQVYESQVKCADGIRRDFIISKSTLLDKNKKVIGLVGVMQDITKRKKAEVELKESEERFRRLHEASFGGIGIHDKGYILDANKGLSDITGYKYDELIGMDGLKLIAPSWRDTVNENILSGFEKPYVVEGLRKDSSTYPLEIQGKQIPFHGKTLRVTEFRDISERVRKEAEQKKLSFEFEAIFNNSAIGIFLLKDDRIIHRANKRFCEVFGYSEKEIKGKSIKIIHQSEKNFKNFDKRFYKKLEKGEVVNTEYIFKRKDGSLFWCELYGKAITPYKLDNGVIWIGDDISARKRMEKEKEILISEFETIFNNSSVGIVMLKEGRVFHRVNHRFTDMFGYSDEEVIGKSVKLIHSSEQNFIQFGEEYFTKLVLGGVVQTEYQLKRKDGTVFWTSLFGKAIRAPDLMQGVIWVVDDIDSRKEMELEKEKLFGELKEALDNINKLQGLLPICANCKKIRDDKGYWNQIEEYIQAHSEVEFSHGLCPDCMDQLYGHMEWYQQRKKKKKHK